MLKMSQIESIREQWSEGKSISEIARAVSVDRNTVYKYVNTDDFSKGAPCHAPRGCKLDAYREGIVAMLNEERKWFRKQRYTAKRILKILNVRHGGIDCSYATASNMLKLKEVRESTKMSQKSFGASLGLSQGTYQKYESGMASFPDELKAQLAERYGINLHWLITGEGSMHTSEDEPYARAR